MNIRSIFKGRKTYALAGVGAVGAGLELLGIDVLPGVDKLNAVQTIWSALIFITLRSGSKADADSNLFGKIAR